MDRLADDPRRIAAGIAYVLRHNLGNGHTCLPADKLIPHAAAMLGKLRRSRCGRWRRRWPNLDREGRGYRRPAVLFLPHLYQAEKFIASRIGLTGFPPVENRHIEENIDAAERASGVTI